jgi:hypothetical protein
MSHPSSRVASVLVVLASVLVLVACSSDDEAGGSKTPAAGCTDLCTAAAFSGSRVDVQPNEINCFCTGGTADVAAAACTSMCTSIGKTKGAPFKSGATNFNACQCD